METEDEIHKKRNWIATVVTLGILFLAGLFVWRVLFYSSLIKKGEIDPNIADQLGSFSTSLALESIPIADGAFDVATQDDPSLGAEDAPMTIVEFADFGCPFSQEVSFVIRAFVEAHPKEVRYVYRDFPITELHPIAQRAAEAGECAHEQKAFWSFHDKVYLNQNDLSEERFYEFAREVGINESRFRNCMNSGKYTAEVLEDAKAGFDAGVRGTPTFFINGNRIPGSIPKDVFEGLLTSILLGKTYAP